MKLSKETLIVMIVLMYGSLSGVLAACIDMLKCGWLPLALLYLVGILFAVIINQLVSTVNRELSDLETCHKQLAGNLHGQNSSLAAQVQECLNKNKQAIDLP